jgi:hypothetical protein
MQASHHQRLFWQSLLSLHRILVVMWINFSIKFCTLTFISRKTKMISSVTSLMPFLFFQPFVGNSFPLFLFLLERFGTFQRWKLFVSKCVDIITIVSTAIFAFCVLWRASNNLWDFRIISEFIKICYKMLVLEKMLKTTRVL